MLINISDIWPKNIESEHSRYVKSETERTIIKNPLTKKLLKNFPAEYIATSKPKELRRIIQFINFTKLNHTKLEIEEFIAETNNIFNYKRFSDKNSKDWNAYQLCKASKYKFCPYCQQNTAITIYRDPKSKSIRPTLDHFYPKSQYPYLALSLYNLIPSCHSCNSSLKSTIDFYLEPHLHPYEDSEIIQYGINHENYIKYRKGLCPIIDAIEIELCNNSTTPLPKGNRSIKTFLIKERIEFTDIELTRFIKLLENFPEERIREINEKFFNITNNSIQEDTILQFSYSDYKNEWLGKAKKDIYSLIREM